MAGCLDQCERGPTVVIYPQGIWYGGVQPDDVPRILDETVEVGGRVLEDCGFRSFAQHQGRAGG